MAILGLFWLGSPKIELNGSPLRLELRKTLALLAYLSLSPQNPTRETLAALFWPEYDQQHALANLRRNLASLAKSLPPELFDADRERIGLRCPDWLKVDVMEFNERLASANRHSDPSDPDDFDRVSALEKAVSIYRGDFLEGFNLKDCPEFDEWLFFQRESLRSKYGSALQELLSFYQSQNEWDKAIESARSWLALDRLDEQAHRALMEVYFLSGQKTNAIKQFEACQQVLDQELSQPPEPATVQLYEEICAGRPPINERQRQKASTETIPSVPAIPTILTKYFIQKVPRLMVERSRLVSLLDQGSLMPLTVISAAAGFGKTTLLAEWVSQTRSPVAWVGLDDGDNDPSRLISYVIGAIRNALPFTTVGSEALELLVSTTPVPPDAIMATLVNDLLLLPAPVVLVLDDYHLIKNQEAHQIIRFLLDHQPDTLRLVLATRADPPLPLARMRVNRALFEIRTDDLRFTSEESRLFLNDLSGLGLSKEDIDSLEERAEGWIAGFKMISLAIQKNAISRRVFIQTLRGSHRYILDYLMEEVLGGQPKPIQAFLKRTSILDRFCASMCEAILGPVEQLAVPLNPMEAPTSETFTTYQQILEYLDRANMFLTPLDEERCWYRYHHLFADLLQSRLKQTEEDSFVRRLHLRASAWLEENELPLHAIDHAFLASDYERAARLVETYYLRAWEWNELASFETWIKALPKEVFLKRPKLCSYHAYFEMLHGRVDGLDVCLDNAENQLKDGLLTEEDVETLGIINLTRAHLAGLSGNWAQAIELTEKYAFTFPGFASSCNHLLWFACFIEGDLERARSTLDQSIKDEVYLFSGSLALAYSYIARIDKLEGHLNHAEKIYLDALKMITERGWNRFYVPALIEFGLADLLRERNEPEKAWKYVRHGLDNTGPWFPADALATGYTVLSRVLMLKGDYSEALAVTQEAQVKLAGKTVVPHLQSELDACSLQAWLAQGNLRLAEDWLQDHSFLLKVAENENTGAAFQNEYRRLDALRILLAQRKFNEALSLSDRMIEIAKRGMRTGRLIEIEALQAIALQGLGFQDEALQVLSSSLILAQPEGYLRIFLDEGMGMEKLLQAGKSRGMWQDLELRRYVDRLVAAFQGVPDLEGSPAGARLSPTDDP